MNIVNNKNLDGVMGILATEATAGGRMTIGQGWEGYSQPDSIDACLLRYLEAEHGLHRDAIAMVVDVRDYVLRQKLDEMFAAAELLAMDPFKARRCVGDAFAPLITDPTDFVRWFKVIDDYYTREEGAA